MSAFSLEKTVTKGSEKIGSACFGKRERCPLPSLSISGPRYSFLLAVTSSSWNSMYLIECILLLFLAIYWVLKGSENCVSVHFLLRHVMDVRGIWISSVFLSYSCFLCCWGWGFIIGFHGCIYETLLVIAIDFILRSNLSFFVMSFD